MQIMNTYLNGPRQEHIKDDFEINLQMASCNVHTAT